MTATSELWAITSYFNPVGFHRRLTNYRSFRRLLNVPLITVELSFGAPFELDSGDADMLLQLRGQSVLWQKERLLNVALKHLPSNCKTVAWIDCDVIFVDEGWSEKACEQLDRFPLVQLFTDLYDLGEEVDPAAVDLQRERVVGRSIGAALARGPMSSGGGDGKSPRLHGGPLMGLAWAGRREVLEAAGFYDACIVGGGVRAMASAALAQHEDVERYLKLKMNPRQEEHYRPWAERWWGLIEGNLGYLETSLLHLWHGDIVNRGYTSRHEQLARFGFDPFHDLALDDSGCWRWNTAKPEMHQFVKDYFSSRREDG
jgi:hypothetical protein